MRLNRLRPIALSLILLELAVSFYLLFRHFSLATGHPGGFDVCSALFGAGCDAALASSTSIQFGIPLAGWGIVYYTTLLTLILMAGGFGDRFQRQVTLAAVALSTAGGALSIALLAIMLTHPSVFCPLCSLSHVMNLAIVFLIKQMTGRSFGQLARDCVAVARGLVFEKMEKTKEARWHRLGFLLILCVALAVFQWVRIEELCHLSSRQNAIDPLRQIAMYESGIVHDIAVEAESPTIGPEETPLQLVVFNDFQCPSCRDFAHVMPQLLKKFEGKLKVSFKHLPQGAECNDLVKADLHPRACEAAKAAEAARRQRQFWPFHDALFEAPIGPYTDMTEIANAVGLDRQLFETDRNSQATDERIKADIEQAAGLGVYFTPALFLNGRQVFDLRAEAIELLINYELQGKANKDGIPRQSDLGRE